MLKVGITGGIGTGKSTVCKIFNTIGIPTYDADREAKQLYNTNTKLKQKVIARFGAHLYDKDVFIPKELAKIVFSDSQALKDLNALVHPMVIAEADNWLNAQHSAYALKEAALLIESGGYKELDKIIVVQASLAERIERIKKRDGITKEQINKRIEKQMPEDEKEKYADFIISNNEHDKLIDQVLTIHNKLLAL